MKQIIVMAVMAAALLGCASTKKQETPITQADIYARWQMVSATGFAAMPNATEMAAVVMDLRDTKEGYVQTGCNTLNVRLLDLTDNRFEISKATGTRMACPSMAAESFVATQLPTMQHYTMTKETLTLSNDNAQKITFKRLP